MIGAVLRISTGTHDAPDTRNQGVKENPPSMPQFAGLQASDPKYAATNALDDRACVFEHIEALFEPFRWQVFGKLDGESRWLHEAA
jgi:hypothetical protein